MVQGVGRRSRSSQGRKVRTFKGNDILQVIEKAGAILFAMGV